MHRPRVNVVIRKLLHCNAIIAAVFVKLVLQNKRNDNISMGVQFLPLHFLFERPNSERLQILWNHGMRIFQQQSN